MPNTCPLCHSESALFYKNKKREYHQCNNCKGIFIGARFIVNSDEEKLRYETHNNDVEDIRYQQFVSPITSSIIKDFTPKDRGLDFGAGTGSAISKVLIDNEFDICKYDPFFHNYPNLLDEQYNYIACCEVIEHFNNPDKEFTLLNRLLLPNGKLYCMTDIYDGSTDFNKWYYKNDETHVFIYQKATLHWVKNNFGFLDIEIDGRLIILSV